MGLPHPNRLEEFMFDLKELAEKRHLHLEAIDGELVAVDDTPGVDPIPVLWDESLKKYRLSRT